MSISKIFVLTLLISLTTQNVIFPSRELEPASSVEQTEETLEESTPEKENISKTAKIISIISAVAGGLAILGVLTLGAFVVFRGGKKQGPRVVFTSMPLFHEGNNLE